MIYPDVYYESVTQISLQMLQEKSIKGLILDVDNTLIDFDRNLSESVVKWCYNLKQNGIKMCILSNTNKLDKVQKVAQQLELQYIYFAKKPLKSGFKKAKELLNLKAENIAVVGDQIFTDVIGAKRSKMYAILVKPIDKRDHLMTRVKRPLEQIVINRFLKKHKQ